MTGTAAGGTLGKAPVWLPCALVAVVGWVVGVHQVGPLLVYAEPRPLPLVWYVLEQALSMAATIAALGAASVLFAGRLPSLRLAVQFSAEARWSLALAAALASRAVLSSFLPKELVSLADHGLKLNLAPLQWAWLVVMTLAVLGLMARAASKYVTLLQLFVPGRWSLIAAAGVALVLGQLAGQLAVNAALNFFFWPP